MYSHCPWLASTVKFKCILQQTHGKTLTIFAVLGRTWKLEIVCKDASKNRQIEFEKWEEALAILICISIVDPTPWTWCSWSGHALLSCKIKKKLTLIIEILRSYMETFRRKLSLWISAWTNFYGLFAGTKQESVFATWISNFSWILSNQSKQMGKVTLIGEVMAKQLAARNYKKISNCAYLLNLFKNV